MSKIRLTLPVQDSCCTGKQISFVAPCGSEQVTALTIQGTDYTLVDALGNALSSTSTLWKSGAMVSVILDCENHKAYIQNDASHISTQITLTASKWSNNSQVVTVTGVSTTNSIIVTPDVASKKLWLSHNIECTAQSKNSLTFSCKSTPTGNVTVNLLIFR